MSVELVFDEFIYARPSYLDFGGSLVPPFGGEEQRLNRNGNRFMVEYAVDFDTDEEARAFAQDLRLAKWQGATARFPQIGVVNSAPGTPLVNGAVAGGTSLPVKGLKPFYAFRKGQFFSVTLSGRRYLYSVASSIQANGAGNVTLTIDPPLRKGLAGDEPIEVLKPMIEGSLQGDSVQWETAANSHEPFIFAIREMA